MNFERAPDHEAVRIGKHLWKLDVSAERIKETIAPLREAVEKLKVIMMARPERDREPADYDRDDDVRLIAKAFERMAEKLERLQPNYGGVNNSGSSKAAWLIFGGLVTLNCAAIGWFASSLIEVRQDVAVIKCQLNPACRVVVSSDKP